jgi:predicted cobalt transporter CbtA
VFTQLGLWDATPEDDLAEAATAYTSGDLEASSAAADDARLTWIQADGVGRTRAVMIAVVVVGILLLLIVSIVAVVRIRRARRRHAIQPSLAGAAAPPPATDPDPTEVVSRVGPTTPDPPV